MGAEVIKLIVVLVVHQFSVDVQGNRFDTSYTQNFATPKMCLQHIKDRVMPNEQVQAFRRYKVTSSEVDVVSKELECVVF